MFVVARGHAACARIASSRKIRDRTPRNLQPDVQAQKTSLRATPIVRLSVPATLNSYGRALFLITRKRTVTSYWRHSGSTPSKPTGAAHFLRSSRDSAPGLGGSVAALSA